MIFQVWDGSPLNHCAAQKRTQRRVIVGAIFQRNFAEVYHQSEKTENTEQSEEGEVSFPLNGQNIPPYVYVTRQMRPDFRTPTLWNRLAGDVRVNQYVGWDNQKVLAV